MAERVPDFWRSLNGLALASDDSGRLRRGQWPGFYARVIPVRNLRVMDKFNKLILAWLAVIAGALIVVAALWPKESRPSAPEQRDRQRQIARARVHAAGGWDVLRKECANLAALGKPEFYWSGINMGTRPKLPPGIARLNPLEVVVRAAPGEPPMARLKLFGLQFADGRTTPYYGLWIVCGPAPEDFAPKLDRRANPGLSQVVKINKQVFEIF